jgi:hypothetical protein
MTKLKRSCLYITSMSLNGRQKLAAEKSLRPNVPNEIDHSALGDSFAHIRPFWGSEKERKPILQANLGPSVVRRISSPKGGDMRQRKKKAKICVSVSSKDWPCSTALLSSLSVCSPVPFR